VSRYAEHHHPDVIARKLASGLPMLNDRQIEGWRQALRDIGVPFKASATKTQLYVLYRKATAGGGS